MLNILVHGRCIRRLCGFDDETNYKFMEKGICETFKQKNTKGDLQNGFPSQNLFLNVKVYPLMKRDFLKKVAL